MIEIATSRYHAKDLIAASGLLPLGVTVGAARWLAYELAGNVGALAPYGVDDNGTPLRKLEGDEFEVAYRKRLEGFGFEKIGTILAAFAHAHDASGVVLLCFEDVHKGDACHRRTFADWWERSTGEHVRELGTEQP